MYGPNILRLHKTPLASRLQTRIAPGNVGVAGSDGAQGWALDDGQLGISWVGWLGNAKFVGLSAGPSVIVAVPEVLSHCHLPDT